MARNRTHYQPEFGSISHGTMRPADLIPAFADELERIIYRRHGFKAERLLIREARKLKDYDSDQAQWALEELFDTLNEHAPSYGYFGAHPGDGADYGYWLSYRWQDSFREGDGIEVSDLGEVPADHIGEVLVVSDHGNATLYVASDRARFTQRGTSRTWKQRNRTRFKEVWSVV